MASKRGQAAAEEGIETCKRTLAQESNRLIDLTQKKVEVAEDEEEETGQVSAGG